MDSLAVGCSLQDVEIIRFWYSFETFNGGIVCVRCQPNVIIRLFNFNCGYKLFVVSNANSFVWIHHSTPDLCFDHIARRSSLPHLHIRFGSETLLAVSAYFCRQSRSQSHSFDSKLLPVFTCVLIFPFIFVLLLTHLYYIKFFFLFREERCTSRLPVAQALFKSANMSFRDNS